MVAVAGALAQHNFALLGKSPTDGGDEAERLVDGDEKEDALAVVDGLLALAYVGIHGADQEAQQGADAEFGQDHLRVPQRVPGRTPRQQNELLGPTRALSALSKHTLRQRLLRPVLYCV